MRIILSKIEIQKAKKNGQNVLRKFKKSPEMQKKFDPLPWFLQYSYPIVPKKQKNPQTACLSIYHVCLCASKFGDGCQKGKGQRCVYLKVLFSRVK